MKLIPIKTIILSIFATALSVSAQTPIISYDFEGNNAQNTANAGTYDGTLGTSVSLGSASSFGVAPTTGAYSYVDPGTFTPTAGYSLSGLGSYVANFNPVVGGAGGTGANNDSQNILTIGNTAAANSPLAGSMGVTFAGWVYLNTTTANETIFWQNRNNTGTRWVTAFNNTGSINDQIRIGSGTKNNNSTAGTLSTGVWTFLATEIIYNSAPNTDTLNIYFNGVLSASLTQADAAAASGFPTETSAGASFGNEVGATGGNNFYGYMDGLQLYTSALTGSQVASLYDSYLSPVPEPGVGAILGTGLAGLFFAVRRRK